MRSFLILFIAAAAVVPAAAAQQADGVRVVEVYDGLASFEIPNHWHEIPPDILEFFTLQSAEQSGGLVTEIYQHGFRPGNPEADFAPPQILVQIKESGRLGFRQFLHLPPITMVRDHADDRLDEHMGPLMDDLRLNDIFYDEETHSIHVANTMDLAYEGKVVVQSVSFLTERGLFTIHCYALLSQNLKMKPVFQKILDSVQFDESITYRPRLGDWMPPRPALASYSIAALLAITILVVHIVQRRRRRT